MFFRKFEGLLRKFKVAKQNDLATDLERYTTEYLGYGLDEDAGGREDIEIESAVLQFLMSVSRNPVNLVYTSKTSLIIEK